jgi:hypothetical protein
MLRYALQGPRAAYLGAVPASAAASTSVLGRTFLAIPPSGIRILEMAFPATDVVALLASCKRHCCVCWRRCGFRIELHHIRPLAEGVPDEISNAIPVCFDCHAEIESVGRKVVYREAAVEHKRKWLEIVASNPAALIEAAQRDATTGPLRPCVPSWTTI